MKVVFSAHHRLHAPRFEFSRGGLTPYSECPARAEGIRAALSGSGWADFVDPRPHDDGALLAVHDADYLDFLRQAHRAWTAGGGCGDLAAATFAARNGRRPGDCVAQIGYYGFDTTPIAEGTWAAARAAADAALTAAELVAAGEPAAYALCRPPGHHATRNQLGGYCYLNHAAVAARWLAARGPTAIVDVDYHHGNGTQEIFYEDGRVLFVSLHADPAWEYPLYWGYADETGRGFGAGLTHNVPLPAGIGDDGYAAALGGALDVVRDFGPRWLVVSLGFDTYERDPLGTFRLSLDGLGRSGRALAGLGLPTLIVQEGGYCVEALGDLALRFLDAFR